MAKKRPRGRPVGNPARQVATPLAPVVEDVVIPLSIYGDPLEELAALLADRRALDDEIAQSVAAARAGGVTWASLAGAFGLTRQAVQKRYADADH